MYQPKPMDLSKINLNADIWELTEQIAENVHDNWAIGRIAEGWTYGPVRDDKKKTTPCLVPYAQLPEAEKEYDRKTAVETLKMILALGYRIEKLQPSDGE